MLRKIKHILLSVVILPVMLFYADDAKAGSLGVTQYVVFDKFSITNRPPNNGDSTGVPGYWDPANPKQVNGNFEACNAPSCNTILSDGSPNPNCKNPSWANSNGSLPSCVNSTNGKPYALINYKYAPDWWVKLLTTGNTNGPDATGTLSANPANSGCQTQYGATFCPLVRGDQLCITVSSFSLTTQLTRQGMGSPPNWGCIFIPPPNTPAPSGFPAYIDKSCYLSSAQNAKSMVPITSIIVECITQTMNSLFVSNVAGQKTVFQGIQAGFQRMVGTAMMLAIMLYGIKIALGQDLPKKSDFMVLVLKIGAVGYFALGNGIPTYFPLVQDAVASISNIIFSAQTNFNFCKFPDSAYPQGLSSLALWDGLDCRFAAYLGMQPGKWVPTTVFLVIVSLAIFAIPAVIFLIIFQVFLAIFAVYMVEVYLMAYIASTLLMYLAPLFVPMILFHYTKQWFDNWLNQVIGFFLYPIVISAFMALVFAPMDQMMFGIATTNNTSICGFSWCGDSVCPAGSSSCMNFEDACRNSIFSNVSLGCIISGATFSKSNVLAIIGLSISIINDPSILLYQILMPLLKMALFLYIILQFSRILPQFIGELTGAANVLANLEDPSKKFDKVLKFATSEKDKKGKGGEGKGGGGGGGLPGVGGGGKAGGGGGAAAAAGGVGK